MSSETTNTTTTTTAPPPDFEYVWEKLQELLGDDIQSYRHQYGFGYIAQSLIRLENAQLEKDRTEWSKQWALKLKEDDPEAWVYNYDRKLCLKFLYRLIDKDLMTQMKPVQIDRIVHLCLPMDRANALYNMVDTKRNVRGLHWYAEVDKEHMKALLSESEARELERAPLNRRLRGLLDYEPLNYTEEDIVYKWMMPQKADRV